MKLPGSQLYTVSFAAVAVALAQDLFEITVAAGYRVFIHQIAVGQYTDFGDAAAEILSIQCIVGHATGGSGGSAATPRPILGRTVPAAASVAEVNNTTVASAGTALTLWADVWNIAAGWFWNAKEVGPMILDPEDIFVVRQTVPADSLTMNGTMLIEEIAL